MSEIIVTSKDIQDIISNSEILTDVLFDKCTRVTVKLPNGFIITESSACVDPANFDFELGKAICMKRIENKIWELEGYVLQKKVHEGTVE